MSDDLTNFSDDPKVWGKYYWYVLKSIAHNYPENPDRDTIVNIKNIFYGLQYAIPCLECRNHYREYIKKHTIEPAFSNKRSLLNWINNLEQSIKKRNIEKKKLEEAQQNNMQKQLPTGNIKLQPNQPQQRAKQVGKPLLLNNKANTSSCSNCGGK